MRTPTTFTLQGFHMELNIFLRCMNVANARLFIFVISMH